MSILLWIWQLPQNIVGFIITRFAFFICTYMYARDKAVKIYFMPFFNSGVSLGNYIILDNAHLYISECELDIVIGHEYGHQKQSVYLGPLYLIVIGIPSIIRNVYDRFIHKNKSYSYREKWYYTGYPENWADKLGGINRNYNEN